MWAAVLVAFLLSSCVLDAAPVVNNQAARSKRSFDRLCMDCADPRLYEEAWENGMAARLNRFEELTQRRLRKYNEDIPSYFNFL